MIPEFELLVKRLEGSAIAIAAEAPLTANQRLDVVKALMLVVVMIATEPDAVLRALQIKAQTEPEKGQ